jgi:NTP pyrophosphatase (non-canonical NTP hydrolase)
MHLLDRLRAYLRNPKVLEFLGLPPITPPPPPPPPGLAELQELIGSWTQATFEQAGGIGAGHHLVKEANEVLECIEAIHAYQKLAEDGEAPAYKELLGDLGFELADILILTFDIAHVKKIDLLSYLLAKHEINKNRKWAPPDANGVQQHIEEGDYESAHKPEHDKFVTEARELADAGVTIKTTMRQIGTSDAAVETDGNGVRRVTEGSFRDSLRLENILTPAQVEAVNATGDMTITRICDDILQETEELPDL